MTKKNLISLFFTCIFLLHTSPAWAACPSGYQDYGDAANCATKCTTSCAGASGECCKIDQNYVPTSPQPNGITAPAPVTKDVIDQLNPLIQNQDPNADPNLPDQLSTPGGIVSRFLGKFAFPIAGFILFLMLIWGGVEMMAGSATSKSIDAGKQRVTAAIGGFLLLFVSYWLAKIIELMFGIKIL